MAISTNLSCAAGQAITFTASAETATAISGWTFAFTIYDHSYVTKSQVTSDNGITVTDEVNGVMTIALSSSDTNFPPGRYYFDLFRTDIADCLARGHFYIERSAYQATTPP